MTTDASIFLSSLLSFSNSVFSTTVPGFTFSFRSFFLSILATCLIIVLIKFILGSTELIIGNFDKAYKKESK